MNKFKFILIKIVSQCFCILMILYKENENICKKQPSKCYADNIMTM